MQYLKNPELWPNSGILRPDLFINPPSKETNIIGVCCLVKINVRCLTEIKVEPKWSVLLLIIMFGKHFRYAKLLFHFFLSARHAGYTFTSLQCTIWLSTAKRGDNVLGSVRPSICPSVSLSVCLFVCPSSPVWTVWPLTLALPSAARSKEESLSVQDVCLCVN